MQDNPSKSVNAFSKPKIIEVSKEIGKLVGLLHKNGVMHGDLTTSNFILFKNIIYMIDFGPVSYTHLRAHETDSYLVCRLLLEKN